MNTKRIVPLPILLLAFTILGFPSFSNGAIIETQASAAMQILYDPLPNPPYIDYVDVSQTVTNPTNAQVILDGTFTTGQVHSIWHFNDLDTVAGHGNLFFDYGMIGNDGEGDEGEIAPHYMGYTVWGVNYGTVTYFAESDSEIQIGWDFTVWDVNSTPLSMDLWKYNADGTAWQSRLDAWSDLAYNYGLTGEETYLIEGGYRYILTVWSNPNISGGGYRILPTAQQET